MEKRGFSAVFLILLLASLALGSVFTHLGQEVRNLPTVAGESTQASPEAKVDLGQEVPNLKEALDNPEVKKVAVRNTDDTLEVELDQASGEAMINRWAKTNSARLEDGTEVVPFGKGIAFGSRMIKSTTNFPLSLNRTTGQLSVTTPNGARFIRILPDQASEIAKSAGIAEIKNMELVETPKGEVGDKLAFKITGKRAGNFLGIFPIDGTMEAEVGAQSGLVLSVSQPWWLRILAPLIR